MLTTANWDRHFDGEAIHSAEFFGKMQQSCGLWNPFAVNASVQKTVLWGEHTFAKGNTKVACDCQSLKTKVEQVNYINI